MSKINWVDGSYLTPSLQNAYWGTGADSGHHHSGQDEDGSVPKIDLATEVNGILDPANVGSINIETGTTGDLSVSRVTNAVTTDTAQSITGIKTLLSSDTTSSTLIFKNSPSNTQLTLQNQYLATLGANARSLRIYGTSGGSNALGVEYLIDWAGLSSTTVNLADLGLGSDLEAQYTTLHFDLTFCGWTGSAAPNDLIYGRYNYVGSLYYLISGGTSARSWAYSFTHATALPGGPTYATVSPGGPVFALMYNASLSPNGFYWQYTPVTGTRSWSIHGRIGKQYISSTP